MVNVGKVPGVVSPCERGWNEGGLLLSGKQAVLLGKILWPRSAEAAAGGKRRAFFLDELGAWDGSEEDPGRMFYR